MYVCMYIYETEKGKCVRMKIYRYIHICIYICVYVINIYRHIHVLYLCINI